MIPKTFPNVAQIVCSGIPSAINYEQLVKVEDLYKEGQDITVAQEDLDEHAVRAVSYGR